MESLHILTRPLLMGGVSRGLRGGGFLKVLGTVRACGL